MEKAILDWPWYLKGLINHAPTTPNEIAAALRMRRAEQLLAHPRRGEVPPRLVGKEPWLDLVEQSIALGS